MKSDVPAAPKPLVYSFRQFYQSVYPCSRARATQYASSGELATFVDRGRRYVTVEAAKRFVRAKAAKGGAIPLKVSQQRSASGKKGRAAQLAVAAESEAAS
ncbi:MAG TPA: hypothetical protein VF814_07745 [Casimicrobiaceae bacterium]